MRTSICRPHDWFVNNPVTFQFVHVWCIVGFLLFEHSFAAVVTSRKTVWGSDTDVKRISNMVKRGFGEHIGWSKQRPVRNQANWLHFSRCVHTLSELMNLPNNGVMPSGCF